MANIEEILRAKGQDVSSALDKLQLNHDEGTESPAKAQGKTPKTSRAGDQKPSAIDQIRMVSPSGRLCGYFSQFQLSKLLLPYEACEDGIRLTSEPSEEQRNHLLAASMNNPSITRQQKKKVRDQLLPRRSTVPKPEKKPQTVVRSAKKLSGAASQSDRTRIAERSTATASKAKPNMPKTTVKHQDAAPSRASDRQLSAVSERKASARSRSGSAASSIYSTDSHYIARDARGLALGLYTENEIKAEWGTQALRLGSIFAVDRAVAMDTAAQGVEATLGAKNSYTERVLESLRRAVQIRDRLGNVKLKDRKPVVVKVLYKSDDPVCVATQACVAEQFGKRWFLVDRATVQIVVDWNENKVMDAARQAAAESSKKYVMASPGHIAGRSEQDMFWASSSEPSKTRSTAGDTTEMPSDLWTEGTFEVHSLAGKAIYRCGKKKAMVVRSFLENALPWTSFESKEWGLNLTAELIDLGFKNETEFASFVASQGRVRQDDANATGEIAFYNRSHTLYVFKGTSACVRKGHQLEAATGILATLYGIPVEVNVNYCPQCRKYFIGAGEYQHYRNLLGPVVGNFKFVGFPKGDGFESLAAESPLMLCGYNVREGRNGEEGLTPSERHTILAAIIEFGILSKPVVINYLNSFISRNRNNPRMWLAVDKWEDDLEWVRQYNMNKQRRFVIDGVKSIR